MRLPECLQCINSLECVGCGHANCRYHCACAENEPARVLVDELVGMVDLCDRRAVAEPGRAKDWNELKGILNYALVEAEELM